MGSIYVNEDENWALAECSTIHNAHPYPQMYINPHDEGPWKIGNFVYKTGTKIRFLKCKPSYSKFAENDLPDLTLLIFNSVSSTGKQILCTHAKGPSKGQKVVLTLPATFGPQEFVDNSMESKCPYQWHKFLIGPGKAKKELEKESRIQNKSLLLIFLFLVLTFLVTCTSGGLLGIPIVFGLIIFILNH